MRGINAHNKGAVAELGQSHARGCSKAGFANATFAAEQQNPHNRHSIRESCSQGYSAAIPLAPAQTSRKLAESSAVSFCPDLAKA